jgi:hypothetical protein
MARRGISAETLERVRQAARAARELDPQDRELLDIAHMGAALPAADVERLAANPLAWAYGPLTMCEVAGVAAAPGWWQAPPQ